MSGGGAQPAGNTTTTQTQNPWSGQQPYLTEAFQGANNLYQNYSPQYFPQSTVAPFNPTQKLGLDLSTAYGLNGNPAVNSGTAAITGINSGALLGSNPYLNATEQNVLSNVVPGIEATFNGGNRMNSPGGAFAASQGAASAIAPYAFSDYETQIGNILKGAAIAPELQNSAVQNLGLINQAGQTEQGQQQAQLNDAINRWNFGQQLPYNRQSIFDQMISGTYGGTGTLSQPYFEPSTGAQVASGVGTAANAALLASILFA
jgi:hypothetical protein